MKNLTKEREIPSSKFWNGKKVLITGHTGFKGSWLALWLLKLGAKVSGISLIPEKKQNLFDYLELSKNLNHNILDIRNKDELTKSIKKIKPDIVFHLAAQPLVLNSYKEPILTWETNVNGTLNVLYSLQCLDDRCGAIFITTDKVYKNKEWIFGYRENDLLGGIDPYSSSKAASEIAIASWRESFCGSLPYQKSNLYIASARSGNVIGGGDWSNNRIVPDIVRSLSSNKKIIIRNPSSTRPWQHVLDPLSGYLLLAERLYSEGDNFASAFNFGPNTESNKTVLELVEESLKLWSGSYEISNSKNSPHEAGMLNLSIEKSFNKLKWRPKWDFYKTINVTISWYKMLLECKSSPLEMCINNISDYENDKIID